jgi:hypothetical protein
MYSTCIFCHRSLGRNEVIEAFPVGRRLAFDPGRGRLWAVCERCRRWNLSPLEERWEAVEECERTFRELRTRVHSQEIGVAAHPEGLRLVRIGEPIPVEFAVFRYGETMGRRARRQAYFTAAGIGAGAVLAMSGALAGFGTGFMFFQVHNLINGYRVWRSRVPVPFPDGSVRKVLPKQVDLLNPTENDTLGIRVKSRKDEALFFGEEARRTASRVFPVVNFAGARQNTVKDAVEMMARAGGAQGFLGETWGKARPRPGSSIRWVMSRDMKGGGLGHLPPTSRVAFEMALHEEQERRALEGELKELQAAWRQAEELARISDDLLVPEGVEEKLRSMKEDEPRPDGRG